MVGVERGEVVHVRGRGKREYVRRRRRMKGRR